MRPAFAAKSPSRLIKTTQIVLGIGKDLCNVAIGLLALIGVSGAWAQSYPNRPVHLMVGFAPGGSTDVTARLFAQKMAALLGQPVVVENRPGASGSAAAEQVAKSAPDGYRLLMLGSGTVSNAALRTNMPISLERDLTPISLVTIAPMILVVHPSVPAHSVSELIELARSKPGQLNFSSEGVGGNTQLAGELFNSMAKVKLVHVPFKGGGESAMALASGQVDLSFPSMASAMPMMRAGKYRALAVTGLKRSTLLPTLPTLDESGLHGYNMVAYVGILGPVGLPKAIVEKLNAAIANVAKESDIKESVQKQGMEVEASSPEQFATFLRESLAQFARLGKEANIKLE